MDWSKVQSLTEHVKVDAESMRLDEFLEKWPTWFFPIWDKYNLDDDHDEQIFEEK